MTQGRFAYFGDDLWLQRIIEVHHDQTTGTEDIGVRTGNGQVDRPVQLSIWIKGHSSPQEVILGITIRQRIDIDHDEPFSLISHKGIAVYLVHLLLLILLKWLGEPLLRR